MFEAALKKAWLDTARKVVEGNPNDYTRSELESVLIGVKIYDPELTEKIRQMIRDKKK